MPDNALRRLTIERYWRVPVHIMRSTSHQLTYFRPSQLIDAFLNIKALHSSSAIRWLPKSYETRGMEAGQHQLKQGQDLANSEDVAVKDSHAISSHGLRWLAILEH